MYRYWYIVWNVDVFMQPIFFMDQVGCGFLMFFDFARSELGARGHEPWLCVSMATLSCKALHFGVPMLGPRLRFL